MATGIELVLGFPPQRYQQVARELGVKLPTTEDDFEDLSSGSMWHEWASPPEELRKSLREAHRASLIALGFTQIPNIRGSSESWRTPEGDRTFSTFSLTMFWDPSDMEEEPHQSTFGVGLSGRYSPTFLDWRSPHGTLWPLRFDAETVREIEVARREICQRLPAFAAAELTVIECHY